MSQIIDMTIVQELLDMCDGDHSSVAELIETFLDDSPVRVTEVQHGIQAGDLEQVERAAHSLKGSAGNIGATDLMEAAEALQLASHAGEVERVRGLGPGLELRWLSASRELRSLLDQLDG